MSREEKQIIDGFRYWIDTNTERGVTTIPNSLCEKVYKLVIKKNHNTDLVEEFEKIKAEIIAKHCNKCDVGYDIEKCYADNLDEWCEVFDNLKIIDKHIAELKGEQK